MPSRPIQTVSCVSPFLDYNIVLTIDHRLQGVAQRAFEEHILTLGEAPGTQAGAVVAINPKTGEIRPWPAFPAMSQRLSWILLPATSTT